jgi:hypothetical protein
MRRLVRVLKPMDGMRDGYPYPAVGEVMQLQEGDTGIDLVRNGNGEFVEPEVHIEAVVVAPPENAAKRTTKPKPRTRKTT